MNFQLSRYEMDVPVDEELISNIEIPSLPSISSDDSSQGNNNDIASHASIYHTIPGNTLDKSFKRLSLSIFNENPDNYFTNKSASLHDVSGLQPFSNLRRDSYLCSTETLNTNTNSVSKDSGFQRSTSCTSLTGGYRKYDHVQSKVKQYIQNIKQNEAIRKMQNRTKRIVDDSVVSLNDSNERNVTLSKKDLVEKVKELENEIVEKDHIIVQLAKDHTDLKLKYAAAENRMDDMRIRMSYNDSNSDILVPQVTPIVNKPVKEKKSKHHGRHESGRSSLEDRQQNNYEAVSNNQNTISYSQAHILKSASCKSFVNRNERNDIRKSDPNVDRYSKLMSRKVKDTHLDLPQDEDSFVKVERWQKSLSSADNVQIHNAAESHNRILAISQDVNRRINQHKPLMNNILPNKHNMNLSRQYYNLQNEKLNSCAKRKTLQDKKFCDNLLKKSVLRSISNSSCEDASDESNETSTGSSSTVFIPRHERYREFKQRKIQERVHKHHSEEKCNSRSYEVMKAKSSNYMSFPTNGYSKTPTMYNMKRKDVTPKDATPYPMRRVVTTDCSCFDALEKSKTEEREKINKLTEHVEGHRKRFKGDKDKRLSSHR